MDSLRQAWRTLGLLATWTGPSSRREPAGCREDAGRDVDAERGQGLAEYSLVLGLIAITAIAALAFLGSTIEGLFWAPISDEFGAVLRLIFGP